MKNPSQEIVYFLNSLEEYMEFIKFSERFWPEELQKYETSLKDEKEDYGDRFDYRNDLSAKLSIEFPQLQRRSCLVMLLALFEDFLNQLCQSIKKYESVEKNLFDINGKGIDRAKKYLTEYSKINFPVNSKEWQSIRDSQQIRNIIVHSGGHVDLKKHEKAIRVISTSHNLNKQSFAREHLVIENSYLLELVSDIKVFCNMIITEYQNT